MNFQSLKALMRSDVQTRGLYGSLNDHELKLIAPNIQGVLMGDECVHWNGKHDNAGAPKFSHRHGGVMLYVSLYHNIVEDLTDDYGRDKGMKVVVRHKCLRTNGKKCINPAHMQLGSQSDNIQDDVVRDKTRYRPFSEEQVIAIRTRRAAGEKTTVICRDYGVSSVTISLVCTGQRYSDFGGPITRLQKGNSTKGRELFPHFQQGKMPVDIAREGIAPKGLALKAHLIFLAEKRLVARGVTLPTFMTDRDKVRKMIDEGKSVQDVRDAFHGSHKKVYVATQFHKEKRKRAPPGEEWHPRKNKYIKIE